MKKELKDLYGNYEVITTANDWNTIQAMGTAVETFGKHEEGFWEFGRKLYQLDKSNLSKDEIDKLLD